MQQTRWEHSCVITRLFSSPKRLALRSHAPVCNDPPLIIGQVGQQRSDQVGVWTAGLVTDLAARRPGCP